MALPSYAISNQQTADWRLNAGRTNIVKAIITPKMIRDICNDDPNLARSILASLYHNDRPKMRRLCALYCQQYKADYDTLWPKWERWVLTGRISSVAPTDDAEALADEFECRVCGTLSYSTEDGICVYCQQADKNFIANTPTEPPTETRYCHICLRATEFQRTDVGFACNHCQRMYDVRETLSQEERDTAFAARQCCLVCGKFHQTQYCLEITEAVMAPLTEAEKIKRVM